MYRWFESRILWGTLLILGGVLFLLQNLGVLEFGNLFWALLLGLGGLFFLSFFFPNRANWWALIPGFTLLSVALLIVLNWLVPQASAFWGGGIILGGIGLSFLIIYLLDQRNWWAIIPAGVLLTLALVATIDSYLPGVETGGLFFLGMGLTFALVALIPTPQGQMRWAWIPAGILGVIGFLILSASQAFIGYLGPVILILLGGLLVLRTIRPRSG